MVITFNRRRSDLRESMCTAGGLSSYAKTKNKNVFDAHQFYDYEKKEETLSRTEQMHKHRSQGNWMEWMNEKWRGASVSSVHPHNTPACFWFDKYIYQMKWKYKIDSGSAHPVYLDYDYVPTYEVDVFYSCVNSINI